MPLTNKEIKARIREYEDAIRAMNERRTPYDHTKKLQFQNRIKQLKAQKQSLCQTPNPIHSTT
jgi:hypothetical protein